jgi:putative salt-induced outer membrane protein YdiY
MQLLSARSLAALSLALALIAAPAFAESDPATDLSAWAPPEVGVTSTDRITLKSGETLYGDFEILRDHKVFFDSDAFDDLDVKWSKVDSAYLVSPHVFRLNDRNVTGTAEMRKDVVRVRTSDGEVVEFARSEIVSIIQGGENESSYWSGDVGVAFSLSKGNSDQVDASAKVHIKRETGLTRWVSHYRGIYSELDGDENAQNHRASSDFDIYVARGFFVTAPSVEYFRDEFQNVRTRITPGLALGYEFARSAKVEWNVSLGGSYQYTEFFEGADADHNVAVVGDISLEIDVTSNLDLDTLYTVQLVPTDLDRTNHHLETELSIDVLDPVELDITFIWDRIEKPVASDEGDRSKSDDIRVMVGLSVDF